MSKKVYIKPELEVAVLNNNDNNMLYLVSGNYNGSNLIKGSGVNKVTLHS